MAHHKIKLADHRERKNQEGRIDIELSDESTVTIPPPELWPDEILKKAAAGEIDDVDVIREIVGSEPYDRFVADGGTAVMALKLIEEFHGEILGK